MMNQKKSAIFLDRDGVLNKLIMRNGKAQAPYTIDEFELYPGVIEALEIIKAKNYLAIVVTNQPDVSRGWVPLESVELINNKIRELLPIDDIKICFHENHHNCHCRKPLPGMLLDAAKEWNIDLISSFMIGDRFGDIGAGHKAGCKTILIGKGDEQKNFPDPDYRADLLIDAIKQVIC